MSNLTPYPDQAADREAAQRPPGGDVRYASWGRRAGAYLLDTLIVFCAIGLYFGLAIALTFASDTLGVIVLILGLVALIAFPIWYHVYFVGKDGQTLGRRWLGIRVVDATTGEPIGYGRAFGRALIVTVFAFFTIPLIVDYLWPLWDSRNQTLHDKAVSSIVIRL